MVLFLSRLTSEERASEARLRSEAQHRVTEEKQEYERKFARRLPPEHKSSAADRSSERVQPRLQKETKDWNPSDPESSQQQFEEVEDLRLIANVTEVTVSVPSNPSSLRVQAVLDTGSDVNVIKHAIFSKLVKETKMSLEEPSVAPLLSVGGVIHILGRIVLRVCLHNTGEKAWELPFIVIDDSVDTSFDLLLGWEFLRDTLILQRNVDSLPVPEDSQSQASMALSGTTLDPTDDPELAAAIHAAAANAAHILSYEKHARELHVAAIVRLGGGPFEQNMSSLLDQFSRNLAKNAASPSENGAAWLMRRQKAFIAHAIRTEFAPENENQREAMASLNARPSAQMEHLQRFVEQRFPDTLAPSASRSDVVYTLDPDPEYEDDELPPDLPSVKAFGSIDHLRDLLTTGEAYTKFRDKYQTFVFPRPRDVIDKALRTHLPAGQPFYTISCDVKCEILEYLKESFGDTQHFGSIMTITGQPSHAVLAMAGQYLKNAWTTGNDMVDALESLLTGDGSGSAWVSEDKMASVNESPLSGGESDMPSKHERESRMTLQVRREGGGHEMHVTMEGSLVQISERLEQLAWVTTIFRRPLQDQLTVSECDFAYDGGLTAVPKFRMSLLPPSSSFPVDADEPGQCWTSLFPRSILAYGFPVPEECRPDGMLGLEIPFHILTTFAGIQFPIRIADGLLLAGLSTLLVPGNRINNAIQWHYLSGDDRFERLEILAKSLEVTIRNDDLDELAESTAFLGHCREAVVRLGTQGLEGSSIEASEVAPNRSGMLVEKGGTVSVGVSKYATAQMTQRWRWTSREGDLIPGAALRPIDRLERARDTPTLLYDDEACRAWLVSELSVALHMTHGYLSQKKLSSGVKRRVPLAKEAPDGGQAALEAITHGSKLFISFEVGKATEFSDIVEDFLDRFERRKEQKKQEAAAWTALKLVPRDKSLKGWDFADLKSGYFRERRMVHPVRWQGPPIWWNLFEGHEVLVVFGRKIGCPIQSSPESSEPFCSSWNNVPVGQHTLTASVPCLQHLQRIMCVKNKGLQDQFMLSDKVGWARPAGSRLFEICTPGANCTPVQTMQMVFKGPMWEPKAGCLLPPTVLEPNGAVIFADRPDKLGRRLCHVHEPIGPWQRWYRCLETYWKRHGHPYYLDVATVCIILLTIVCLISRTPSSVSSVLRGMVLPSQVNLESKLLKRLNDDL